MSFDTPNGTPRCPPARPAADALGEHLEQEPDPPQGRQGHGHAGADPDHPGRRKRHLTPHPGRVVSDGDNGWLIVASANGA